MSALTRAEQATLIAMRCRTAERSPAAAPGVETLAATIGRQIGAQPRLIGSPQPPREQSFEEDLAGSRGCLLEAGGQVEDALNAGTLPLLLAADAAIALTTLPTIARMHPDARVLWLDGHAAFHTPATTTSSYLGGMALAGACGLWDSGFEGHIPGERVVLCGVRELEEGERENLSSARVTVIGSSLETLVFMQNALDGAPVYVHLDVDVMDPDTMPVSHAVRAGGGFDDGKLLDLLEALGESCEVIGVEVTGFEAGPELAEQAGLGAEVIAGVLDPLLP
ncbi:MAG TPA: arginase family protein [Solirubrobacteraceae bacterium]|jgi:arginase family enzyme|nr:arginase family protein [Solirubrobacteraceae bacterium]